MSDKIPATIDLPNDLAEVRKLFAYVWPLIGAVVLAAFKTKHLEPHDILVIVSAFVVGIPLIWQFKTGWVKGAFSLFGAVVAVLLAYITSGMDWSSINALNWTTVGAAVVGSVLATFTPNKTGYDPGTAPSPTADNPAVLTPGV
jgi:hypothetical protein